VTVGRLFQKVKQTDSESSPLFRINFSLKIGKSRACSGDISSNSGVPYQTNSDGENLKVCCVGQVLVRCTKSVCKTRSKLPVVVAVRPPKVGESRKKRVSTKFADFQFFITVQE